MPRIEPADLADVTDLTALAELAALAEWAEARLPGLVDDAYAATIEGVPFYRDKRLVPTEELRDAIEQNMRFLITAMADPRAPLDLAAPEATGRRRAHQGAPLPEILQCYRICFTTLWDALVEQTRSSDLPPETKAVLTAAGMIMRLTDRHALALTESYRAATAELLLAQQQRRAALVEALLTGHPGPEAGPWEAATLLGLPADGLLVVVAADTRGLAEASLRPSSGSRASRAASGLGLKVRTSARPCGRPASAAWARCRARGVSASDW